MRLCLLDLNGKGYYLRRRLSERFEMCPPVPINYDVILVDSDHPLSPPVPQKNELLHEAVRRGIPICLYPHGANPMLDYDGLWRKRVPFNNQKGFLTAPPVSLQLLHGEGHAELYRCIGFQRQTKVVGWTYCPTAPPVDKPVEHVVFAPIHPWADGKKILDPHGYANHQAYEKFRALDVPRKTVRLSGEDIPNGVFQRDDNIVYEQAGIPHLLHAIEAVEQADAVISAGTFAYLALARGKPTVMLGQDVPVMNDEGTKTAQHWDEYKDYLHYPANAEDGPLAEQIERAADQSVVGEWKRLFVGEELDVDALCAAITALRPNRASRRKLARAKL